MFILRNDLETLKHIIDSSNRITFFTGAGVSVASGVPDFRSMGGLFDEISKDGLSPEYLLSRDYLEDDPEGFINFAISVYYLSIRSLISFMIGLQN